MIHLSTAINLPTVLIALLIFAVFAAVVVNGIRRRGGGCGCSGCSGCSGCGASKRARTPEPGGRKPS